MWRQGNLSASVGQQVATRMGELSLCRGWMNVKGARSYPLSSSGQMMTGKGVGVACCQLMMADDSD